MKLTIRLFAVILLLALILLPGNAAYARGLADGKVIFGSTYAVKSGETLSGDLVVFGGVASIDAGGTVTGNVVVLGGSMIVNGDVTGDAVIVGGAASLGATATIHGDMVTVGGILQRADGARILGQVVSTNGPVVAGGPSLPAPTIPSVTIPNNSPFEIFFKGVGLLVFALLGAGLALLIGLFMPEQLKRAGQATTSQPLTAGGMGCLTIILAPAAIILLAITFLLAPIAVVALILFGVAIIFGWLVLGFEVGERLLGLVHHEWPVPFVAALGTFILTLVVGGLNYIPCVGFMLILAIAALTLGAVVMTRFGTHAALPALSPAAPVPLNPGQ